MENDADQRRLESAWDYYLGGSDLSAIADALGYPTVEALRADLDAYIDSLDGLQKQSAALTMFINLEQDYPSAAERYRLVAERLHFGRVPVVRSAISLERKRLALKYRYSGKTFQEIARLLGFWTTKGGVRIANGGSAYKAFKEAMEGVYIEDAGDFRKLNLERLGQLLDSVWESALTGHPVAIQQALSIIAAMDRYMNVARMTIQHSGNVALTWESLVQQALQDEDDQTDVPAPPSAEQGG